MNVLRTDSGVRPGWKLFGFVLLAGGAWGTVGPLMGVLASALPVTLRQSAWAVTTLALLMAVTWLCLRLEGRGMRDIGLAVSRRKLVECTAGFSVGAAVFAGLALVQANAAGTSWHLNPDTAITSVAFGLGAMLVFVLIEEVLFRGYAFRQLSAIGGNWIALVVSSIVFGLYHLIGKPYWGMGAFFVVALPALGGLVFGYALLRSGGLMLPIGLHWGANWASTSLFGWHINDAGTSSAPTAVWVAEADQTTVRYLMSPDLLPHVPYIAAALLLAVFAWRFRSAGSGSAQPCA